MTSLALKITEATTPTNETFLKCKLRDMAIAPENPRGHSDVVDEDLDDMADSLHPEAAGLIYPMICRPGRGKKEKPVMILDGSRRFRGFHILIARGEITEDYEITVKIVTTDEEIAAAVIISNEKRKNLSQADTLIAIKRMTDRKLSIPAMARALNEDPATIKRNSIVAALPSEALEAFRAGNVSMKLLKLMARVTDANEQRSLAKQALHGHLGEGHISDVLNARGYSLVSNIMLVVDPDEYKARGGKVESDLLQELPDRATDITLAVSIFAERTAPLAELLRAEGIEVLMASVSDFEKPDDAYSPYVSLNDEQKVIKTAAETEYHAKKAAYIGEGSTIRFTVDELNDLFLSKLAFKRAALAPMTITKALIHPSTGLIPVDVDFYTSKEQYDTWELERRSSYTYSYTAPTRDPGDPAPVRKVEVDTAEASHVFHSQATAIASLALQNSLSQNYQVSINLLIAHMFVQTNIRYGDYDTSNLLQICVSRKLSDRYQPTQDLDEPIVKALRSTKEAFLASGKTPLQFVTDLDFMETQALLCNLVAFSSIVTEDKTTMLQQRARADAGEVSVLLGHDIRTIYMPDAALYAKASKKQLQGYATELNINEEDLPTKKSDMASFIAEKGYAAQWVPAALTFQAPEITAAEIADAAAEGEEDDIEGDDDIEALPEDEDDDQVNVDESGQETPADELAEA